MLLSYKTRWLEQAKLFRTADIPARMLGQGISKEAVQSQPPKLLLQPSLRKAVDKEENCNKMGNSCDKAQNYL